MPHMIEIYFLPMRKTTVRLNDTMAEPHPLVTKMITGLKAGESPEIVYRSLDAENRAKLLKVLTEIRASILRRRQQAEKDDSGDQDEAKPVSSGRRRTGGSSDFDLSEGVPCPMSREFRSADSGSSTETSSRPATMMTELKSNGCAECSAEGGERRSPTRFDRAF